MDPVRDNIDNTNSLGDYNVRRGSVVISLQTR